MLRMRTINEAYKEIKNDDPGTSITVHAIRRLVVMGIVPSVKCGKKYLVNLDDLFETLRG